MKTHDANLIMSGLSGSYRKNGLFVEVKIYRPRSTKEWILEVVIENTTSILWDASFAIEVAAYQEFMRIA